MEAVMYSPKPIPGSFLKDPQKTKPESPISPVVPIEAKEKPSKKQAGISPLAALLFFNCFSAQKKDG